MSWRERQCHRIGAHLEHNTLGAEVPAGLGTYIYICALATVAALAWRKGSYALLQAYVFFVPWFGLQANVGLTLNIDRFVAAALVAWALLRKGRGWAAGFGVLLMFLIANTAAQSIDLPATVGEYPALQGEWRWIFQIAIWALIISPAGIIGFHGRDVVRDSYRTLVISSLVLACMAIGQTFVFYATGIDLLPIGMLDPAGAQRSAVFHAGTAELSGAPVFRAGAFGGEPKHLALTLVLVLVVLTVEVVYGHLLFWTRRRVLLVASVCFVALVGTFSSQGFLLAAGSAFTVAVWSLLFGGTARGGRRIMALIALAGVALAVALPAASGIFRERTVDRIADTGALEDWNKAVLEWLWHNPSRLLLGSGLGNVHLYASEHIPAEAHEYMAGRVFVAKSGILRLLSEGGAIGCALFLIAYLRPLRHLLLRARRSERGAAAQVLVGFLALAHFALSADGPIYVFVIAGLSIAAVRAGGRRQPLPVQDSPAKRENVWHQPLQS